MNCETLSSLLEEIPMPRWTGEQRNDAREHCQSCDSCQAQYRLQEAFFADFDKITLPESPVSFELPFASEAPRKKAPSRDLHGIWSGAAVLFLCVGCFAQLFSATGFSPQWLAVNGRLETMISLFYTSPALSIALILVALVYGLLRRSNEPHQT